MLNILKVRKNPITVLFLLISVVVFLVARVSALEKINIVVNIVILIWVGLFVERLVGSKRYVMLVLGGVVAGVIAVLLEKSAGLGFGSAAAAILFYYYFALPWKRELPFKLPNIVVPVALVILSIVAIVFRWVPFNLLHPYMTGALVGVIFVGIYKSKVKLSVPFSIVLLLFLLFVVRDPYASVNREYLAEIVARDTVVFSQEVPAEVTARLGAYDALIIGEYHDISGHQELLVSMLPGLYEEGYRYLIIEWFQAESWVLNNYVQSSSPFQLIERMDRVYGVFLEGVRRFNSELPEGEGFTIKGIDINWASRIFVDSLEALASMQQATDILDNFVASVRAGARYGRQFAELERELKENQAQYIAKWGQSYWGVLEDMIYAESRSRIVRSIPGFLGFRERHREEVMKGLVDKYLERAGKVVANVGSFHAQKEYRYGTSKEWLAEYLVDPNHPLTGGNAYSLTVVPAEGSMRLGGEIRSFSLDERSSPGELFLLMSELAGDQLAFLSLDDEVFIDHNIEVNYHHHQLNYPVKRHYDGFILLPSVEFIGLDPSM